MVGFEQLVLSPFPFLQDNSHVQLISIHLFCKVMELVVDEGKKSLKTIVNKSLYPLLIYCHDEKQQLAKVRFGVMLVDLWEGTRLPPALVPGGLQPCPGLGTGTRVLCPALWGHLCNLCCSPGISRNAGLCGQVLEQEESREDTEEG